MCIAGQNFQLTALQNILYKKLKTVGLLCGSKLVDETKLKMDLILYYLQFIVNCTDGVAKHACTLNATCNVFQLLPASIPSAL